MRLLDNVIDVPFVTFAVATLTLSTIFAGVNVIVAVVLPYVELLLSVSVVEVPVTFNKSLLLVVYVT